MGTGCCQGEKPVVEAWLDSSERALDSLAVGAPLPLRQQPPDGDHHLLGGRAVLLLAVLPNGSQRQRRPEADDESVTVVPQAGGHYRNAPPGQRFEEETASLPRL